MSYTTVAYMCVTHVKVNAISVDAVNLDFKLVKHMSQIATVPKAPPMK